MKKTLFVSLAVFVAAAGAASAQTTIKINGYDRTRRSWAI